MKFSIVQDTYKYCYPVMAILFYIPMYFFPEDMPFRIVVSVFLLILCIVFVILGIKSRKIIFLGEITFNESEISVLNEKNQEQKIINISNIDKIVMNYNAFKGELPINGSARNFITSMGGRNQIKIHIKDGIYKYNLYLENQADAIRFKMLYRFLKDNDINIIAKGL